jgi:hypothetical protein
MAGRASTTRCSSRRSQAFARRGGPEAGQIARDYWTGPNPERRAKFLEVCDPPQRARPDVNPTINRSLIEECARVSLQRPGE